MRSWLVPAAVLLCSACAGTGLRLAPDARPPAGEAVVGGRIGLWVGDEVVLDPRKAPPEAGEPAPWSEWAVMLVVAAEGGGAVHEHAGSSSSFRWHLPPGRYRITGFGVAKGSSVRSAQLGARFEVPVGGEEVCLGRLLLALDSRRQVAAVEDDCPAPGAPGSPVRALLELEGPEAGEVDARLSGTRSSGFVVLHGGQPVSPALGGTAESLRPTLAWEPITGEPLEGLTYDVEVYLAVPFGSTDLFGPLVASGRRLAAPSFTLERPLKPGARYHWRVRQRRGEVVGPWSSYDRTTILLVYNAWARGALFHFSAPQE